MPPNRLRNLIPPVYGVLVVVAFLISVTVGVVVLILGGMISGLLWAQLSGSGGPGRDRSARAAARSARRDRG